MANNLETRPTWMNDTHTSTWERVREALRRDWEQTKHDLHAGGHELNQKVGDTVAQGRGKEGVPAGDAPNPPKVIGSWADAESAIGFGYAARTHYGTQHPEWNTSLEHQLKSDWKGADAWDKVKLWVHHGYDAKR